MTNLVVFPYPRGSVIYTTDAVPTMPRGPTVKCPNKKCRKTMSACYVKTPRSGKVVYAGSSFYCRYCGVFVISAPKDQRPAPARG